MEHQSRGELVTGLLYIDESSKQMHAVNNSRQSALVDIPYEELCPGADALAALQRKMR